MLSVMTLHFSAIAQYSDSVHYYTAYNSSGTYNRTRSGNYFILNNTVRFGARKKHMTMNFMSQALYGKQNSKLSNRDFNSILDVNLYKTFPHFYYWAIANFLSSYSLKVNQQLQAGAGIAYNFIDTKSAVLNLSDGFIVDYSNVTLPDTTKKLYSTVRNSVRVRVKLTGKILNLTANGFYQPSIEYRQDIIFKADMTVGIRISKWFSLTGSLTYNEVRRTATQNLFMTYGLLLEKYF